MKACVGYFLKAMLRLGIELRGENCEIGPLLEIRQLGVKIVVPIDPVSTVRASGVPFQPDCSWILGGC